MNLSLIEVKSVDSTNSEALRHIEAGARVPFFLRADQQRQGRGRGGKPWSSPQGNLYGTFALTAQKPDPEMAQVSFIAAVALAEVLEALDLKPQLKWPNDILIEGAKISGILLEKHKSVLLVGIGVNISSHPEISSSYKTTSLAALGKHIVPKNLAQNLRSALSEKMQSWQERGFGPIRKAWLKRAYGLGQVIDVRLDGRMRHRGVFSGLDDQGALQLKGPKGLEIIHAGEVYFHAAGH